MVPWALPLRERLAVLWHDRGVRRRARRLLVVGSGWMVVRALGRLCVHLPVALGDSCHEAAVLMGKLARAAVWALGAG